MTEPSKKAMEIAAEFGMDEVETDNLARLIGDALAEARLGGHTDGYVTAIRLTEFQVDRAIRERNDAHPLIEHLTAERDALAATVERVRALADEWESDTEFAHKAHYADEVRDALDGADQ